MSYTHVYKIYILLSSYNKQKYTYAKQLINFKPTLSL